MDRKPDIYRGYSVLKYLFLMGAALYLFIYTPVVNAGNVEDEYLVSIGDVLEINVINEAGLKTSTGVTTDGTISFPYIGAVYVEGLKVTEIEKLITDRLNAGYIKYPVVTVSLLSFQGQKYYVYGEINRGGEFPYRKNYTILKALSVAGGFNQNSLHGSLKVRRKQEGEDGKYIDFIESEIKDGVIEKREVEDILFQPDDILIVNRNKTFLIQGEVSNRGRFALEKDMTVVRALLQAGGAGEQGRYGSIKVRRKEKGQTGGYTDFIESRLNDGMIESSEVRDTLLEPDDILLVERNITFLIQGEVSDRGRVLLEKGITVIRALLQAGGVMEEGRYGSIKVRRKEKGQAGGYADFIESRLNDGVIENSKVRDTLLEPDDILLVERNKTFLIQGEISGRGRVLLEKGMTVVRALLQAGGATQEGRYGSVRIRRKQPGENGEYKDFIESKLDDGVIENSEVEGMLLQPDDILIVESNEMFYIYGEINKIGEYVLKKDMTVFKALTIAGGLTKWGSKSRVEVLRKDGKGNSEIIKVNIGDIIKGDASTDVILQPGDTIIALAGIF